MLVGGIQRPKHFGQSGQPSPAPDTRTSPPTKIKKYVDIVDHKANFLKVFKIVTSDLFASNKNVWAIEFSENIDQDTIKFLVLGLCMDY